MLLKDVLKKNRSEILDRWFQSFIRCYSPDAAVSFTTVTNQFQNPIGFSATKVIEILFDELIGDMNRENILSALDTVLRIRAVQELSPARSVSFVFELKSIIRDITKESISENESGQQLENYYFKIDQLALIAFDTYMSCREKLFELKLGEAKGLIKPFKGFAGKKRRPTLDADNVDAIKWDFDTGKE